MTTVHTVGSASRSQQARVCLARQVACRLSLDNATRMYTWTRGIRDSFEFVALACLSCLFLRLNQIDYLKAIANSTLSSTDTEIQRAQGLIIR
jgi:hypothetical protein